MKRSNSASLLALWIKVNLSILMNETPFEQDSRRAIRDFDMKYSSHLSRKYVPSVDEFDRQDLSLIDSKNFLNFLYKLEVIIQKNFWECTPLFTQQIFILVSLTRRFIEKKELR